MTDESIFAAALAICNPSARAAYLDRACAADPGLRRQVEELLAALELWFGQSGKNELTFMVSHSDVWDNPTHASRLPNLIDRVGVSRIV
jgi:hypothetical protein